MNKANFLYVLSMLVVMTVLGGCTTKPPLSYSTKRELFSRSCAAQGGRVVGGFSSLDYRCQWPTTDSGKTCRSNSDCQSVCEVPGGALKESPEKAQCQAECANPASKRYQQGYPVELCKEMCVSVLEYAAPIGARMSGACSAKRYDFKTVNCMWLYIDDGKVTKADCFEE